MRNRSSSRTGSSNNSKVWIVQDDESHFVEDPPHDNNDKYARPVESLRRQGQTQGTIRRNSSPIDLGGNLNLFNNYIIQSTLPTSLDASQLHRV